MLASIIDTEEFAVKLFPSYTPTIWINLGTPYFLKNGHNWKAVNESTDVLILRNEIIERTNLPADHIFTIKFLPGALEAILGASIPVLLSAGDADPWCRQFYNQLIKRTMPNSQLLLIHNRGHGSGYIVNGIDYLELFLKSPYQRLTACSQEVKIE